MRKRQRQRQRKVLVGGYCSFDE
jgi:hypothetical protein